MASDGRSKRPDSLPLDETAAAPPAAEPGLAATLGAVSPALLETQASTSATALPIAIDRVDRYVIKRRLGAGGMGVVFEATDSELGRDVAIKMIKSGASADRLKREAQALARLDHRNVVTVYDVGEHEGRVFVAMALVDGSNLHEWLDRGPHTTERVLDVLFQAAEGIIAAHEAGLIHRDLKPDNIFVANDGSVLVGDFGLARDAADDDGLGFDAASPAMSLTQTGHVLGTPAYMAPEQAEGDASERSDQFSFCVTAYEALYGTRPFIGATFQEILDRVDSGEIEQPKHRSKVPVTVARAIRRGLVADPTQRWPSMRELVGAMKHKPRRAWPWLAGGLALIAAVAVTIAVVRGREHTAASPCSSTAEVDLAWTPARRMTLAIHLATRSFAPGATAEIVKRVDDYASRWTAQHESTCVAQWRGVVDAPGIAARTICQTLALAAFEETLQAIEGATDDNMIGTARRIAALPPVERCASDDAFKLAVGGRDHEKLMRELTDANGKDLDAYAALRTAAEAAKDLPAQLEIAIDEVKQALAISNYPAAEAALERGMPIVEQLDASAARAHLLALTAQVRCVQGRDPESYLPMAEAAGKRLDPTSNALEVSAVLEARASCLIRRPDPAPAIPVLEELIALTIARHGSDLEEVEPRSNLALVLWRLGRANDARAHDQRVLEILTRYSPDTSALGEQALMESNGAFMAGDLHTAIAHQQRGMELLTQPIHKAQAFLTLAMYYDLLVDWRAASAAQDAVIKIVETLPASAFNEQVLAESYVYGGWDRLYIDDIDGATKLFDKGLPLAQKHDKTELIAVAQLGLGRAWLARKEYARAIRFLQEGLATHTKLGDDVALYRVGIGQFALAQAEWALGDRHAARESAQRAELNITKGLDQARANALGKHGMKFKEGKLDELARWRDAHK